VAEEQTSENKSAPKGGPGPSPGASPGASPGPGAEPRKELEGFRVTRAAPVEAAGPPVGVIVVAIVLVIVVAFGVIKMNSGDDPAPDGGTETSGTGGPDGTTKAPETQDVPVPDYVTDRLDFLDGEGDLETALDYAEENEALTPNRLLRAKIAAYRKELGIDAVDLTPAQLAKQAKSAMAKGDFDDAIAALDEALETDTENAHLYFLRGKAKGLGGDNLGAVGDLQSALDLEYEPADEVETLIKRFE
jgi:hypothetical protein